jgi:hypothetical protein
MDGQQGLKGNFHARLLEMSEGLQLQIRPPMWDFLCRMPSRTKSRKAVFPLVKLEGVFVQGPSGQSFAEKRAGWIGICR